MGEYIEANGHRIKVGTCESAYYLRRAELERDDVDWSEEPHSASRRDWLTAPGTWWRFPWPDEDGQGPSQWGERDAFKIGAGCVLAVPGMVEIPHGHNVYHLSAPGGGYGVNVCVACPYTLVDVGSENARTVAGSVGIAWTSSNFDKDTLARIVPVSDYWVGDKPGGTVFKCIYCDAAQFRLDRDELRAVRSLNVGHCRADVLDRLVAFEPEVAA